MKDLQFLEDVKGLEELVELRKLNTGAWNYYAKEKTSQFMPQNWLKNWKTIAEVKINYNYCIQRDRKDSTSMKHDRMITRIIRE